MPILTKSAKFYKSVIKLARFSKPGGGIKIQVVPPNQSTLCTPVGFFSFPRASVGMPSGRASVPFPQRWRVAHCWRVGTR